MYIDQASSGEVRLRKLRHRNARVAGHFQVAFTGTIADRVHQVTRHAVDVGGREAIGRDDIGATFVNYQRPV